MFEAFPLLRPENAQEGEEEPIGDKEKEDAGQYIVNNIAND